MHNIIKLSIKASGIWVLFKFIDSITNFLMRFSLRLSSLPKLVLPLMLFVIFFILCHKSREIVLYITGQSDLKKSKIRVENINTVAFFQVLIRLIGIWVLLIIFQDGTQFLGNFASGQPNWIFLIRLLIYGLIFITLWFGYEQVAKAIITNNRYTDISLMGYYKFEKTALVLIGIIIMVKAVPGVLTYILLIISNSVKQYLHSRNITFLQMIFFSVKGILNLITLNYVIKVLTGAYLIILGKSANDYVSIR